LRSVKVHAAACGRDLHHTPRFAIVLRIGRRLLGVANQRGRLRARVIDPYARQLLDQLARFDAGAALELTGHRLALALDVLLESARAIVT
jgi:hypothetical protein